MKGFVPAALLLFSFGGIVCATHSAVAARSTTSVPAQTIDVAKVKATPIYLADFELHAVPPRPSSRRSTGPPSASDPETAAIKAKVIVDFLSATLQQNLQKAGFTAVSRMPADARPESGVRLRGVFAEPDERNHIRRVILGSGSPSPELMLYVCTENLAKPEQAFYQIVLPETPGASYDPRYGVLITLTPYVPLAKYEFSRDPTEEELGRATRQMVGQLTDLLTRNSLAIEY